MQFRQCMKLIIIITDIIIIIIIIISGGIFCGKIVSRYSSLGAICVV